MVSASMLAPSFLRVPTSFELGSRVGNILVVIQLSGGNDGLNMVVPYGDDVYYRHRPTVGIPTSSVLKLDDHIGLNPALGPLMTFYDQGQMSILNEVGYPNPNRSHFRSMDIWQSASDASKYMQTGWIGRYLDSDCEGCEIPYHAIEIGDNLSLALQGESRDGFAMRDAKKLVKATENRFLRKLGQQYTPKEGDDHLSYLYKTMIDVQESAQYISEKAKSGKSKEKYPIHSFGKGLQQISELILSDAATRVYYISLPGFDTHVNQVSRHNRLLKIYAEGVSAFIKDLQRSQLFEDVAILTFSEFGRRVAENSSRGTDHGAANNVTVMGGRLKKAGIYNAAPNLTDLDDGDLRYKIDFRDIYTNILRDWLQSKTTIDEHSREGLVTVL